MNPENISKRLLAATKSKAKMWEYEVSERDHPPLDREPSDLLVLTIGILGEAAASVVGGGERKSEFSKNRQLTLSLQFSAQYFDSLIDSKTNDENFFCTSLLGAAAYYLCDMPGSSQVLIEKIKDESPPDLDASGLDTLVFWLLVGNFETQPKIPVSRYSKLVKELVSNFLGFFSGKSKSSAFDLPAKQLRGLAYAEGTDSELFFADVAYALLKRRIANSSRVAIPAYTGISVDRWNTYLMKSTSVRELWPSQHLLGQKGVLNGESTVIQMPTSAGKTRAVELIIRSAFLSDRTSLAVIVAPFRALVSEISLGLSRAFESEPVSIDEISDVPQNDFESLIDYGKDSILVLTPEKLLFILRQEPDLAEKIGLLIYDEGHQFDSGTRGVNYELLVATLKGLIPKEAQTILISAVISNAAEVSRWLFDEKEHVVSGTSLIPTRRSVAFVSWLETHGSLGFVDPLNADTHEFSVPNIIEQEVFDPLPKEKNKKVFPVKDDSKSASLYMGLKLVHNGAVAIFCGRKSSAANLCEEASRVILRSKVLIPPIAYSDVDEVERLHYLHTLHLGKDSQSSKSAALGVFVHHANTPPGVRLAVEHAMKEGKAKFVICTSTLAQGVNLPIRYLIVTGVYQGTEHISVRDFQNLIGRAGRSGMHTEGTIIFGDHTVFDQRKNYGFGADRWNQFKGLLHQAGAEPCGSSLYELFLPFATDDKKGSVTFEPLLIAELYIEGGTRLDDLVAQIIKQFPAMKFSKASLRWQIDHKVSIIRAIESFILGQIDGFKNDDADELLSLAKRTLAFRLGSDAQRTQLFDLFSKLRAHIREVAPTQKKRRLYSKMMLGTRAGIEIEKWLTENRELLEQVENMGDLFDRCWSLFEKYISHSNFRKLNDRDVLREFYRLWLSGKPYFELLGHLTKSKVRFGDTKRARIPKIEHVVDLCENAMAYEGVLILGALAVLLNESQEEENNLLNNIQWLQKRLRYGVKNVSTAIICEHGFPDRMIADEIQNLTGVARSRKKFREKAFEKRAELSECLLKFPSYFGERLKNLLKLETY